MDIAHDRDDEAVVRGHATMSPPRGEDRAPAGRSVEAKSGPLPADLGPGEDESRSTHAQPSSDGQGEDEGYPALTQLFIPMPGSADRQLVRATQSLLAASDDDYADILLAQGIDSFETASVEAVQRLHGALA